MILSADYMRGVRVIDPDRLRTRGKDIAEFWDDEDDEREEE